jgi:hypothetical protein
MFRHVGAGAGARAIAEKLVTEENGDGLRRLQPTRLDSPTYDPDRFAIDSDFINIALNAFLIDPIHLAHRIEDILGSVRVIHSVIAIIDTGWIAPGHGFVIKAGSQKI